MNRTPRSNTFRVRALAAALVVSAAALAGCGSGEKTALVSGKVSYNGSPVTGGTIMFHPADGSAPLGGPINPDGTFSFGGISVGPAKVTIETESIRVSASTDYMALRPPPGRTIAHSSEPRPVYVKIPARYKDARTSGLTAEVKKGKNKDMDFSLAD